VGDEGARALVFDAGPLIAYDRADRRAREVVRLAAESGRILVIPAAVLAQVWRDGRRQARLARLIALENTHVDVLDEVTARAVGELCARRASDDIADASVVLSARMHRARIVTSDGVDIRRLDPALEIAEL
jgi:hypothetical protein